MTENSYHHGNLRAALLEAARDLLEAEGVAGVSLRGVARAAGVSRTAPYRHFADKQALLAAVAAEGFRAMGRRMQRVLEAHEDPTERLRAIGIAYVEYAAAHREHFHLMFSPELADRSAYPELEEAAITTFGLLQSSVADAQEAGQLRDAPLQELALLCWSVVHGLSALLVDRQMGLGQGQLSPHTLARTLSDHLLLGLQKRA